MRQERGWAIRACVLMRVGGSVLTEAREDSTRGTCKTATMAQAEGRARALMGRKVGGTT